MHAFEDELEVILFLYFHNMTHYIEYAKIHRNIKYSLRFSFQYYNYRYVFLTIRDYFNCTSLFLLQNGNYLSNCHT